MISIIAFFMRIVSSPPHECERDERDMPHRLLGSDTIAHLKALINDYFWAKKVILLFIFNM